MKFSSNSDFSIKAATQANNTLVKPYSKAKFITSLWKLNLRPQLHLFAWKLTREMFFTKGKLRQLGININSECPSCNKVEGNIDHIFINFTIALNVWVTINTHNPTPITNNTTINWLEYMQNNKNWYSRIYVTAVEKVIIIIWAIWTYRNSIVF